MKDEFSVEIREYSSYTQCVITGAVLTSSFKALQETIDKVLLQKIENDKYVVFDFSKTSMISSTCINVINSRKSEIKESKWELVIIPPEGEGGDIFHLTGFSRIYPVYNSMALFLKDKNIKE